MAGWVGIAVTAVLSLAALYFGHNLNRRRREALDAAVDEKRFPAYAGLWEKTKVASPTRATALSAAERAELFDDLTDWYYEGGNGMLLSRQTRNIYLKAKTNLVCAADKLVPRSLAKRPGIETDAERSKVSVGQLSLLRTSMRADLKIFTKPYDQALDADDVEFLEACDVNLRRRPWRNARQVSRSQ